jgi:hypothetical protein
LVQASRRTPVTCQHTRWPGAPPATENDHSLGLARDVQLGRGRADRA